MEAAGVYVNHGGIGMVATACDPLTVVAAVTSPREALRLVACFDGAQVASEKAPESGWDRDSLAKALERHRAVILSFAPVDAFVGREWIGSTEV